MASAQDLLRTGPSVINLGLEDFIEDLKDAGTPVTHLEWRPHVPPHISFQAARLEDQVPEGTGLGHLIHRANREVLERISRAQPVLVDIRPAREVVPGMTDHCIFHAGPPIEFERMCGPMKGAVMGALMYEGLAASPEEAIALAASGDIHFAPCNDHQAVGPMAGVLSPSMPVLVVQNRAANTVAYASMNEGWGRTLRFGAYDPVVIERLRWIQHLLAPVLREAIHALGGVDVKALTAQALHMGDECHNRDIASTNLFIKTVFPAIVSLDRSLREIREVINFLGQHEHFFLNISMAACKATLMAAHGVAFSSVVTVIARNGVEVGIKVSGLGERWFTAPAPIPDGLYFPGHSAADANPDIGDSAISETCGIGAFCMGAAPAIVQFVGGSPADAVSYTRSMYEITVGTNPGFTLPPLDFAGAPTGIDVRRVVETGITPVINTGIAHKEPGHGLVGAGVCRVPMGCFTAALEAMTKVFRAELEEHE